MTLMTSSGAPLGHVTSLQLFQQFYQKATFKEIFVNFPFLWKIHLLHVFMMPFLQLMCFHLCKINMQVQHKPLNQFYVSFLFMFIILIFLKKNKNKTTLTL